MSVERKLKELMDRRPWLTAAYGVLCSGGRTLFRRCPASLGAGEIQPPPFFVIGAARSGNTLLRALLVGHTAISIPPESYVLGGIARMWDRVCYRNWDDLVRFVVGEFENHSDFHTWEIDLGPARESLRGVEPARRSAARIVDEVYRRYTEVKFPGATMWGDKTPLNTERVFLIDRVFPGAKYIHMLRDGRDAVSSAVKVGLFGGGVESACGKWLLRVRNARDLGRRVAGGRFVELRYEDLVSDPRASVEKVCGFLGVPFEEQMMEHDRAFDKMGDTTRLDHHAKVGQPVTTDSIGKWKERLSADQVVTVEKLLGDELVRTGYVA
jgi:hypothetical protein